MMKPSVKPRRRQLSCSTSVAALLAGAVIIGGIVPAEAGTPNWIGAASGDWFSGTNWDTNAAPGAADTVFVDTTTPNKTTLDGGVGTGTATITNIAVGFNHTGDLTITNGGSLGAADSSIGYLAGSQGTVTVTGVNSRWNSTGFLSVGRTSDGTLVISNGASVSDDNAFIGEMANSTGHVTVDGSGSSWNTATQVSVGYDGTGTLTISNGGQVTFLNMLLGADSAAGVGAASVIGPGSILAGGSTGGLTIGGGGTGTLNILAGGRANDAAGIVGAVAGSVGTVVVDGSGSTWLNTGSGGNSNGLTIGGAGSGTLTISNGAIVQSLSSGSTMIADQAGSTGVLNIGAAPGAAAVAPGTLFSSASVQFGAGTGTINFNHTGVGYVFSASIQGPGTVNQIAGETILTASSGFTGPTNVTGGRLAVDGEIYASTATVSGGGILGGIGNVGSIVANAGGIVAPGDGIGTLNVANNVTFALGSILQVEVNAAGQGDRLVAGGIATLSGGTVQVLAGAGNYSQSTNYTILSAAGGVNGTFAGVTSNLAFYTPSLLYQGNDVDLVLTRNSTTFMAVGVTPNQIAAASGVASLGSDNAVNNAVLNLSAPQAQQAFDRLSGEVYASTKGVLIDDSRFVRDAAINRIRSAFGAVGASSGPFAAYAADGTPVAATTDSLAFWGQGFGSWGSTDGNGNAAALSRSTGGFLAGGDAFAFDGVRVGAFGGYSRTNFNVADRGSSGSSDNYHLGVYGGSQWGALGLRTGAAYTWHQIDTSRSVSFPGLAEQMSSHYDAATSQVFGDLGYRLNVGRTVVGTLAFEPFANLAYVNLWTGGFGETGGVAALIGRSGSTDVTYSTLGLRGSSDFSLNGMAATARGSVGWRHAAGDVTPASLLAFGSGGTSFNILGVPIAEDSAVVEAGLDVLLSRSVSVSLSYVGQAASHAQDNDFKANMTWKF
jgi:outer membrane autotransporter protein